MTSTAKVEGILKRMYEREPLIRAARRELEDLLAENHKDVIALKAECATTEEKP